MKAISVLLVEDHVCVREGLRKILELEGDFAVVGEAHHGRAALALAKTLRPNVVLMDIAMPLLNGLEATKQVLLAVPTTKVIILSAHSDDAYVENAIAAGASGFLLKQASANELGRALREVHKGNTFFSASISRRMKQIQTSAPLRAATAKSSLARLTSREMEVLQLIAEGKANKESASELGISMKTIEKHRQHLMEKIDIHDTAGLTRYAIANGIIESSIQSTTL